MEALLVFFLATLPLSVPIAIFWLSAKAANKWKPPNLSRIAWISLLLIGLLSPYVIICSDSNPTSTSIGIRILALIGITILCFTLWGIWGYCFVEFMD